MAKARNDQYRDYRSDDRQWASGRQSYDDDTRGFSRPRPDYIGDDRQAYRGTWEQDVRGYDDRRSNWDQDRRDEYGDYGRSDFGRQDYGRSFEAGRGEYDHDRFGGQRYGDYGSRFGQDRSTQGGDYGRGEYGSYGAYGGSFEHSGAGRSYQDDRSGGRGGDYGASGHGDRGYRSFSGSFGRDNEMSGGLQGENYRGKGPKGYTRSDERIREDVNDQLSDDSRFDASDITVTVSSGEVTLNGQVESRQAKRAAEDCVEHCSGVKHVQNNLRVREQTTGTTDQHQGSGTAGSSATKTKPKEI